MIISYEEDDELNYDSDECDEPLGMFLDNPTSNSVEDRPHVLGRILDFNDITHIDLMNAEKESLLYVSVPFRDDSFPDSNDLMAVNIRELPVYGKSIDIIIGEE
ncbi:hypothetical protein [Salibacterium salarium]|nr:hypothetical protein [Salibacterium salarium]